MPRPNPFRGKPTPSHHFRTNFIASSTNTYATVHCQIINATSGMLTKQFNSARQNSPSRTPPPGVKQPNRRRNRRNEVHRDAVSHRDREQEARRRGTMAIDPLNHRPARGLLVPEDPITVDLMAQHHGAETRFDRQEGTPPRHYLTYGRVGPEAQVETPPSPRSAGADAGDDPEALPPARQLEAGNRTRSGFLTHRGGIELGLHGTPPASGPRRPLSRSRGAARTGRAEAVLISSRRSTTGRLSHPKSRTPDRGRRYPGTLRWARARAVHRHHRHRCRSARSPHRG